MPGITDIGLEPRKLNKIAILGGGPMGSGIATSLILGNYPVILKEVDDKLLQAGIDRVRGEARIPFSEYQDLYVRFLSLDFELKLHTTPPSLVAGKR